MSIVAESEEEMGVATPAPELEEEEERGEISPAPELEDGDAVLVVVGACMVSL